MNLEQQIKWLERQFKYSAMIGDGDADALSAILESLNRLKDLEK